MFQCKVCGSARCAAQHQAREMMFGYREQFTYAECADCHCLQLLDIPEDLSRYYPAHYYAFQPRSSTSNLKDFLQRQWYAHLVGDFAPLGMLLALGLPPRYELLGLRSPRLGRDEPILDVGSGVAGVLDALARIGFRNLTGIDPFMPADRRGSRGVRLLRKSIGEMEGVFSAILFNHSLEHVADPVDTLRHARRLLAPSGRVIVRTPIAARTWREFGVAWVELDAPRHLVVQSETSMHLAARAAGLQVTAVKYDATAFEIWGSLQYRRGIPLMDERSHLVDPRRSEFSGAEIRRFERRVKRMNRERESGRACFRLRPAENREQGHP